MVFRHLRNVRGFFSDYYLGSVFGRSRGRGRRRQLSDRVTGLAYRRFQRIYDQAEGRATDAPACRERFICPLLRDVLGFHLADGTERVHRLYASADSATGAAVQGDYAIVAGTAAQSLHPDAPSDDEADVGQEVEDDGKEDENGEDKGVAKGAAARLRRRSLASACFSICAPRRHSLRRSGTNGRRSPAMCPILIACARTLARARGGRHSRRCVSASGSSIGSWSFRRSFWTTSAQAQRKYGKPPRSEPTLVFRETASNTNERTCIAAVLPAGSAASHTLCGALLEEVDTGAGAVVLNSLCFDYALRLRTAGTHVSFTYIRPTPVPPAEIVNRLPCVPTQLAWENDIEHITDYRDLWPQLWDANRAVAEAYGLTPDDFDHILNSFPVFGRKRPEFVAYLQQRLAEWKAEVSDAAGRRREYAVTEEPLAEAAEPVVSWGPKPGRQPGER
ncbi:MAG: hypothetical protein ACE5I7_05175 [Candidatus Binatia bacterium]